MILLSSVKDSGFKGTVSEPQIKIRALSGEDAARYIFMICWIYQPVDFWMSRFRKQALSSDSSSGGITSSSEYNLIEGSCLQ